ncbi:MAG: carboxypeptidase regulatory-like domain-containing protein [Candidatus Solibacter usitatus]|nr:carboxypeptidase regulatory-like domain-containing protein [Candidatus Solibacter usitatus]
MRKTCTFLSMMLLAAAGAFAQTSSGSIAGSVVDAQNAVISGTAVTLLDQQRKIATSTNTDAEGRFVFPQILPGKYTITVDKPGFKKTERKDITLLANDRISAGVIVLDVGTVAESIEVSAQTIQLKTESSERSAALTSKEMENIAVNSRSYLQLVGFLPGVVSTANLQTGGHAGLANISANGARFDQNNLTLNGIGNVDTGNNGDQLATISLDSVQEFKVLTSNYQAEYGRSSGAQISVVTKSGGTAFHGSGYLFHRHEGLNANNWKNNRDGLQRGLFRFNDPGYTIGGPVFIPGVFNKNKEKLFFFWSQEFQQQLRPQGRRDATFPTDLERKGDFSQSIDRDGNRIPALKDPLGGAPLAGNIVPASRLYGPGVAMLNFYPQPNAISTANRGFNFTSQLPDSYPRRESLIRGDYNITPKWRVFSHFLHNQDSVTSAYGSFVLGSNFPKVPITDTRPGYSFVASLTTILSPSLTNEATWGFGKNIIHIDPVNDGLTRTKTGITVPLIYPKAVQNDFIPRFAYGGTRIGNAQTFGTNNAPFYNFNTTIEWIDNVTKIYGAHVIKAGLYIQRSRKDQTAFANSSGDLNFGDSTSNPFDTGFGFSNMAMGVYSSYNQASQYATGLYRYTNVEWYGQDQWKITRRLTLDYGLRFQWIQPQFDAGEQTGTFLKERFDPRKAPRFYYPNGTAAARTAIDRATNQVFPGTYIGKLVNGTGDLINGIAQAGKDISKYLIQNRGVHFAPRLGFAWDVTGKQNFVIRAGGGMFYDRFQGNEVFDMITNPPTTFAPTLVNGLLSQLDPKDIQIGPSGLHAFDYNGNVPTVYNYSFGVQTKLPFQLVLDTSYVGSLSRHQLQRLNLNPIAYGATFLRENADLTKSQTGLLGSGALDADFLRPYAGYGTINLHQFGGTANYNSFQMSLTRRFTRKLEFGANYTWSRTLGTSDNRGEFNRIDSNTRLANYALLGLHRAHMLQIYYTYELPSLFRGNRVGHMLVDGWQLSGGTSLQTGSPFTPGFSISGVGNQNITGSYTEGARLGLTGQPNTGTNDPYNRVNPAAFTAPRVGSIGLEAPRNYLINPGINASSLSVQKQFAVTESVKLQLRADAFNVFNQTQFSGINGTLNISALTGGRITNLYQNADGSINNKNGFGTVSNARDPRIMQLGVRIQF